MTFNNNSGNNDVFDENSDSSSSLAVRFGENFPDEFSEEIYFPKDAEIINAFDIEGDIQRDIQRDTTVENKVKGDRHKQSKWIFIEIMRVKMILKFISGKDSDEEG